MIDYFKNLSYYSPRNWVGSCGFVSLIQALSYYDTFYNHRVIPYNYEDKYTAALNESEAKAESPGVVKQVYDTSKYSSYYSFCNDTQTEDFQSYLTVLYNTKNGTNNDGQYKDSNGNLVNNFKESIGAWDYQTVLNMLYGNTTTVKVNDYRGLSQSGYINLIKETISSGNPIIVHIKKYDSSGAEIGNHSVVAYDFDATGIYANFGWGKYANSYYLLGGTAGYTEIYRAATLDFSGLQHIHCDNYIINSKAYCGCNISDELQFIVPQNWANVPPTFYWMKNINDPDEKFKLELIDFKTGETLWLIVIDENQMTLSVNAWKQILRSSKNCWLFFYRISSKTNYLGTSFGFTKPTAAMEHITLSPAEYGFIGEYNGSELSADVVQGKYTIGTKRLRCGYIEHECINLSPRKENAGTAYIDFSLDTYVYRIDVDLCLWSDTEYLLPIDSEAYIQYKNSLGNWVTAIDLLNDIELSQDRLFPENYTIVFPEKTKEFRIFVKTNDVGDRNKGRLCIGDLKIYLEGQ